MLSSRQILVPPHGLQLNPDKSAVIVGTSHQLRSAATISSIDMDGSRLPVLDKLKTLGVTIDSRLRFDSHASNVARACNYHTRALCHVRSLLTNETAQTVACSIVASRLDYCNGLLYGAPADSQQASTGTEQPGESRVPAR